MNIKQLKKELKINNSDIAKMFDMSYSSYANSTAKKRYENALCKFYARIKENFIYNHSK